MSNVLSLNLHRRHLTCRKDFSPTEAYEIGVGVAGGKAGGRGRPKENRHGKTLPTPISPPKRDESSRTAAVAASAVGVSRPTYEKIKAVVESGVAKGLQAHQAKGGSDE